MSYQTTGNCEICHIDLDNRVRTKMIYERHECGCKLLCMMCSVKHDKECTGYKVFLEAHKKRCNDALNTVVETMVSDYTTHGYYDCPNPEECNKCTMPWEKQTADWWKDKYKAYLQKVTKHNILAIVHKYAILSVMTYEEFVANEIKHYQNMADGHREWLSRSKNHLNSYNEWREDQKKRSS